MDKRIAPSAVSDHNHLSKSRVPPVSQTLVWVRKDLVQKKTFTPADCHPAGSGFLPKPTVIKFADLWGAVEGRRSFVEIVKMAGGGRGVGRAGGAVGGRGVGGGHVPPTIAAASSAAAISLGNAPDLVPVKTEFPQPMMQQMGGMVKFFGNQQLPPPGFNPIMMMPQGVAPTLPQPNSQGSSASQIPLQQQPSGSNKNKKKSLKGAASDGSKNSGDRNGSNVQLNLASGPGPALDPKFNNMTCYNCGELGHYVGLCTRIKRCFICSKTGHHMDNYLMWYSLLPTAQYWGSANPSLGFFHVEVEGPEAVQWLNMDNVGVVVVKDGEISAEELEKCFNYMWKVNWYWQIRQVGPKRFLVRFPPKVWVRITGIPAKWLTWKTICQVSTALSVLVNIDWHGIFRSFYKEVRVKVSVRDKSKIPANKLFEMEQCIFLINFLVENEGEPNDLDEDDDEDPGQTNEENKLDDDADLGDDFRALDKNKSGGSNSKMETDPSIPHSGNFGSKAAAQLSLETSVQAKVYGKEAHIPNDSVLVMRSVEENIGKNLIQQFDAESDDDVDDINVGKEVLVSSNPDPPMPPMAWKEKKQWGTVQATGMSSRIPRDGKSVIEKAQDLKKEKNLEIPKANQRRRKKQIRKLKGEAGVVEDNKGMLDIAVAYYKNLFCKESCLDVDLVDDFWDPEDMVSQEHNNMLNADFSEKEVKDAIFGSYAEEILVKKYSRNWTKSKPGAYFSTKLPKSEDETKRATGSQTLGRRGPLGRAALSSGALVPPLDLPFRLLKASVTKPPARATIGKPYRDAAPPIPSRDPEIASGTAGEGIISRRTLHRHGRLRSDE
ncbi:hypothetical protein QYE76_014165 [Lolium multiflorum]|uniref:CCHC-type domain-containing protein n=1 Tax=Lolium multiflorum TaxID=4521 RepID=A0AAD8U4D4_LOLMU|nr:hypothetical protein QYE76_014165 [Lolium multiflorum]